jgi:hypothetical protein
MNFLLFFQKLKSPRVIPSATEFRREPYDNKKLPLYGLGANLNLSCRPDFRLGTITVHIIAVKGAIFR